MNDKPLMPIDADHHRGIPGPPVAHQDEPEITPLDRVLALMRGRWIWAILLGAILGGAGGVAGFLAMEPIYRSAGAIHVEPVLPRGLDLEDQILPMYTSYVNDQAAVLESQRNVQAALQRQQWNALREQGREVPSVSQFLSGLTVEHPRNSERIVVSFDHRDPVVAQAAVQTLIEAYESQHEGTRHQDERVAVLEQRRTNLRAEQRSLRDQRRRLGEEYGTDDLDPIYQTRLNDVNRLDSRLREIEMSLRALGETPGGPGEELAPDAELRDAADELVGDLEGAAAESEDAAADLAVSDIAAMDRQMNEYVAQRRELEREMRRMSLSLGENHREVRQARSLLDSMEETIEEHAEEYRRRYAAGLIGPDGDTGEIANADELQRRYEMLQREYEDARDEAIEVGSTNMEIDRIRDEEEQVSSDLRRVDQRIAAIDAEASVGGHVQVRSRGEEPLEPQRDRRKLAAVAGLTFGGGAGFAIVLAFAFFDRRFRSIHDASDTLGHITMLGILPRLPDDLADPDQASIASHCVHQIRTLLQIGPDSSGRRVFSLTSPGAGDGKTSLALALGLSYTTAGAKTLLIDFDLGAGGLTQRVDAIIRRKIGQVLQREHLVTEQQVEQALRVAQESNRRLGEVLVELGYVTAEDLEEALTLQEQTPVGLIDALGGEPIEHCVAETGIPGLSILPLGGAAPDDMARLSPLTIRRLLEEARQQFDVILVDTGPVPASLDASHIAVESDGVVMLVSRGEQRTQAEKSLEYLMSIDARVAGVVFNRAEGSDLAAVGEFSGEGSLRRSGRFSVKTDENHTRFGPVARAVAGTASNRHGSNGSTNGSHEPAGSNGETTTNKHD